jgi:hypothetical protein
MAKAEKTVLGHIVCPHCGEQMRIIHDKNTEPFGHCEDCSGQLRVGGRPGRVRAFVRRYPWAAASAAPVTVTEPTLASAPVPGKTPDQTPPPRKKASFADALNFLGGQHAA